MEDRLWRREKRVSCPFCLSSDLLTIAMLLTGLFVYPIFFINFSYAVERTEQFQSPIANEQLEQVYGIDLNSSPPRESEPQPIEHANVDISNKIPKQARKIGRPRKHFTEAERRQASIDRKYQWAQKYSVKGIEKAKKTLEGEKLRTFLHRADDHQAKIKERNRLYRERHRNDEKVHNKDIDFNASPKAEYIDDGRKRGRPQKYATEEERKMAETQNKKRYSMKYTLQGLETVKKTMQGEELQKHLLKAEQRRQMRRDHMRKSRAQKRLQEMQQEAPSEERPNKRPRSNK